MPFSERSPLQNSVTPFLDEVARRGSWTGGGGVAAFSAALAAALLEKLTAKPAVRRALRQRRRTCLRLMEDDARSFSRVITAARAKDRDTWARSLKAATEIPCRVAECAGAVQATCRAAHASVKSSLQSDLRCALALALAAETSARTLIETNLAWLGDSRYTRQVRRRLQRIPRRR